jgi:hypothetical protein
MNYIARPAWLNQWWQIGILFLMPLFCSGLSEGHRIFYRKSAGGCIGDRRCSFI